MDTHSNSRERPVAQLMANLYMIGGSPYLVIGADPYHRDWETNVARPNSDPIAGPYFGAQPRPIESARARSFIEAFKFSPYTLAHYCPGDYFRPNGAVGNLGMRRIEPDHHVFKLKPGESHTLDNLLAR